MNHCDNRPDPDRLLGAIEERAGESRKGRLVIYLGMAAGVGKTFSMLEDALIEKERGRDVVVGYIEPHGRVETEALVKSFESIELRSVNYRGISINEFDLDAAIKRAPEILLVDELAHTNAPGSRHTRRYQDIKELLAAGIEVRTTVNIQHVESLNKVVGQITGIVVHETVPDSIFIDADEVEVVDIPPDELIRRLHEGKVYSLDKVEGALKNFFRKERLTALRELVLRHAADRVGAQVWRYRSLNSIDGVWATKERVLVCVAPDAYSSHVLREARRLASLVNGDLIALSVETPKYAHLAEAQRCKAAEALRLAEEVKAEVVIRAAIDIVDEIVSVAKERNVTQIVIGKPPKRPTLSFFRSTMLERLIARCGDVDIHLVSLGLPGKETISNKTKIERRANIHTIAKPILVTAVCTLIAWPLSSYTNITDVAMLFLLSVAVSSALFGRLSSIISAFAAVLAFDIFFVPPYFTLRVSDVEYLFSFLVMLIVGLFIASLTSRMRSHVKVVSEREQRTAALFDLSQKLSSALTYQDVTRIISDRVNASVGMPCYLLLENSGSLELSQVAPGEALSGQSISSISPSFTEDSHLKQIEKEKPVAIWVNSHHEVAGKGTGTLPSSHGLYFPLVAGKGGTGVLALFLGDKSLSPSQVQLIKTFCFHTALALERVRSDEKVTTSERLFEQESVRNTFLSSISHDLRTPLASIEGSATTIVTTENLPWNVVKELAMNISDEAQRLARMIRNVLDITRLESGVCAINCDWVSLEEVVSSAEKRTEVMLGKRTLELKIDPDLPLLYLDALLVEQVFVNLFENLARHTDDGTRATLQAWQQPTAAGESNNDREGGSEGRSELIIELRDTGPGFANGLEESIFEKHWRGIRASSNSTNESSFGLGLPICRAIMRVHGGDISARTNESGAVFTLRFPIKQLPREVYYD